MASKRITGNNTSGANQWPSREVKDSVSNKPLKFSTFNPSRIYSPHIPSQSTPDLTYTSSPETPDPAQDPPLNEDLRGVTPEGPVFGIPNNEVDHLHRHTHAYLESINQIPIIYQIQRSCTSHRRTQPYGENETVASSIDDLIIDTIFEIRQPITTIAHSETKEDPSLDPLVNKELNKLLATKIIFLVWYTTRVENLVPVRKKSSKIRICIDFRNLKLASLKDNYPVLAMEQILQSVSRSALLSLLDGFSGYNQVLVAKEGCLKTTFRTKWGTYAYDKMPFRLINVGSTFQWAMDITFRGLINKSMVFYLDDITIYSKNWEVQVPHLKAIFERCRWYGISLNPKKASLS